MEDIYSIKFLDSDGKETDLSAYKGKVLLIVNTATHCMFTKSLMGLEELYKEYQKKGFEILAFPSNQFASQAPESAKEIGSICSLKYHVTFPTFDKINVNGPKASPLFQYLEEEKKRKILGLIPVKSLSWNFTKFLIGKDGKVLKRFEPSSTKEKIEPYVIAALNREDKKNA